MEVDVVNKVFVAGANGRTGRIIVKLLAREGYEVVGLVRQEAHKKELESAGAAAAVGDLTGAFSDGLKGADAVICAAGAGIADDPEASDHVGTVRLIEQCVLEGIPRFIMISSMGTNDPDSIPVLKPHLIAKHKAETVLEESTLNHTIIRPGGLTDEAGTGLVEAGLRLKKSGRIPRNDVAEAAVLALKLPQTEGKAFDLISGTTPLEEALTGLGGADA